MSLHVEQWGLEPLSWSRSRSRGEQAAATGGIFCCVGVLLWCPPSGDSVSARHSTGALRPRCSYCSRLRGRRRPPRFASAVYACDTRVGSQPASPAAGPHGAPLVGRVPSRLCTVQGSLPHSERRRRGAGPPSAPALRRARAAVCITIASPPSTITSCCALSLAGGCHDLRCEIVRDRSREIADGIPRISTHHCRATYSSIYRGSCHGSCTSQ